MAAKQELNNPKSGRREDNIKTRTEMNETATNGNNIRTDDRKSWLFENINNIDKFLAKLSKRKRGCQPTSIKLGKKGNVTIDTNEIQKIMRAYFKIIYSTRLEKSKRNGHTKIKTREQ